MTLDDDSINQICRLFTIQAVQFRLVQENVSRLQAEAENAKAVSEASQNELMRLQIECEKLKLAASQPAPVDSSAS